MGKVTTPAQRNKSSEILILADDCNTLVGRLGASNVCLGEPCALHKIRIAKRGNQLVFSSTNDFRNSLRCVTTWNVNSADNLK